MNKITPNSQSPKYFNVINPTAAVSSEAARLNKANGSNAKLFPSGNVCFHNDFRSNVESIISREVNNNLVAPSFTSIEAMQNWVFENVGGKVAQEVVRLTAKQFNQLYAGLTVAEIRAKNV